MARVDLTVRGGGIFGLSVAWEAVRRGARVRVIEAVGIGAGSSGGVVGALSPHVPEAWNEKKQFQLDSLLASEAFFAGVSEASGLSTGYGRTGRLQPVEDEALARARGVGAEALWRGQAEWRVVRAGSMPHEPVSASGFLIHDTLSARVNPRLALGALVGAIRAKGGEVVVGEAPDEGPVVWATGLEGLEALTAGLGRPVGGGVKGQAALLGVDLGDAPQVFVDGLHIVPHGDGTVAVGSTSEHRWEGAGTDGQVEALIARARAALPVLRDAEVIERWAGVRPRAVSRAPLLGPWPGREGHFVANGGFKIGFGMAAGVARVMADLVLEGRDCIPAGFHTRAL